MFWTEMEKKAQNHVVLRGNVDVLQGIKAKGEERKKQFLHDSHEGKSVLCACTSCGIRIFEYNRLATDFFSRVI